MKMESILPETPHSGLTDLCHQHPQQQTYVESTFVEENPASVYWQNTSNLKQDMRLDNSYYDTDGQKAAEYDTSHENANNSKVLRSPDIINENVETNSPIYYMPLRQFLESCSDEKEILRSYEKNNNILAWKTSRKLVHLLIWREKNEVLRDLKSEEILESWEVPKTRLRALAEEISETFPGQSVASYYVPFCSEGGKKISASGKLLDHLHYVKRLMRENGILKCEVRNKEFQNNIQELHSSIEESLQRDINYLRSHSEPFLEIKQIFERTTNIRKQILREKNLSVFDYMLSVKSLKLDLQGQELINLDFELLYKDHQSKLKDKWPKIKNYLIHLLQRTKSITKSDLPYVLLLPTLSSEKQDIILFYLLHYITTTDRYKRKRSESFKENEENIRRLSSEEKRNSYLLHVEDALEVEAALENLRRSLRAKRLKLQPLTVIVGHLLDVKGIYVVVDEIKYTAKTILDAIDLSFKIFVVFDCAYPHHSLPLWQFMQTIIYEIRVPGEQLSLQHRNLEGEIKRLVQ